APDTPHPTTTPPTPAPGPVHRAAPTAEVPVVADPATVTPNGWGHPPRLDRPDIETTPDADAARALRNGHATAQTNGVATRTPTAATDIDEEPEDTGLTKSLIEWVAVLGGAFVVALVIKTYLFQAFFIPSQSMEPALMVNDRVLVNKLSYELHGVERGDLVVFERPEVVSDDDSDLIKRVVGLPGETIDFLDGTVYIDGEPLDEDYLEDGVPTVPPDAERFPMLLGDDEAFVMGDNRTDSRDSRFFGPIKVDSIIGRAWVRVWPVSDLGLL
ncbi:MAG: signal peptidase I, partial [Actinomycetota bacterium]|nr:signal peptidase I [Actinomycetota bacterium]